MVYEGGGSRTRQKEKQQSPSVRSTKSASGLSVIKMVAIDTVHCWRCLHHAVYVMGTGTGALAGRCRASTELAPRGQHIFASGRVATISFYSFFFYPPSDYEASRALQRCRAITWSAFLSPGLLQPPETPANATRLSHTTSGLSQCPLPLDLSSIVRLHSEFLRLVCSLPLLACYFGDPPVFRLSAHSASTTPLSLNFS